jgi:hypothetical protein
VALFGLAVAAGCDRLKSEDPVDAYLAVSRAVQKGDLKDAYGAVSQKTRQALDARAHEIATLSDGGVHDDPAAMLFGQVGHPPPVGEVTLARREGDVAVLKVNGSEVRMVREDGAWKLDLVDRLKP